MKRLQMLMLSAGIFLYACGDNRETATVNEETTTENAAVETPVTMAPAPGTSVEVRSEEVPDNVRTTFTTKYPNIQATNWSRYEPIDGDDWALDQDYYYVRYNNNGNDYTDWFNHNGEWQKSTMVVKDHTSLPSAIHNYLEKNYSGYTIVEVDKENDKDMDMYEIELNKDGDKVKLKLLPDGTVFKKK